MTETRDPQTIAYAIMTSISTLSVPSLSKEAVRKITDLLVTLRNMEMPPEKARKYGKDLSDCGLVDRLRATGHNDPATIAMLILDELQKR